MLEIYALLGCSKQQLSYWQINPYSTSTIYNKTKILVIQRAQKLFSLSPRFSRKKFDCGVEALNLYLKNIVSQDVRRNPAVCYASWWARRSNRILHALGSLRLAGLLAGIQSWKAALSG